MLRSFVFNNGGTPYQVTVVRKWVKRMTFRYKAATDEYFVTVPKGTLDHSIIKGAESCMPTLIKRVESCKRRNQEAAKPVSGDSLYLFGVLTIIDGFGALNEAKKEKFLKEKLLGHLHVSVPSWGEKMGIDHSKYALKVRNMKTRFGVNNISSMSLTFSTELVHYAPEVIDSVIIHELAHDRHRDHQAGFWSLVYRYCPDYKRMRATLLRKNYGGDNH